MLSLLALARANGLRRANKMQPSKAQLEICLSAFPRIKKKLLNYYLRNKHASLRILLFFFLFDVLRAFWCCCRGFRFCCCWKRLSPFFILQLFSPPPAIAPYSFLKTPFFKEKNGAKRSSPDSIREKRRAQIFTNKIFLTQSFFKGDLFSRWNPWVSRKYGPNFFF